MLSRADATASGTNGTLEEDACRARRRGTEEDVKNDRMANGRELAAPIFTF